MCIVTRHTIYHRLTCEFQKYVMLKVFYRDDYFPKQCGNTWGSYGKCKRPGWLDRGGGRVVHRFHRYFRGFVLACSFRL